MKSFNKQTKNTLFCIFPIEMDTIHGEKSFVKKKKNIYIYIYIYSLTYLFFSGLVSQTLQLPMLSKCHERI